MDGGGMIKLSRTMKSMLVKVGRGHPYEDKRPTEVSNTNRTCEALERQGLIKMAEDQSRARRTLCFAWTLTDQGSELLAANPIWAKM
jgi:hypothetical protein